MFEYVSLSEQKKDVFFSILFHINQTPTIYTHSNKKKKG
jgi:hypothetical protein